MRLLSDEEMESLSPAQACAPRTPIPTQIVSSDEFLPPPQSRTQREVEARLMALGDALAKRQRLSRRRFFQTASGMAAAFLAMNEVYGRLFDVTPAEAATPELADERAKALKSQFIMDTHTHFTQESIGRDVLNALEGLRNATRKVGWNPLLPDRPANDADMKYGNYIKEMFLDSDTKVALISSAPADTGESDWFLSNEGMAEARRKANTEAGSRRLLSHTVFTPGQPGWLEGIDKAVEVYKPDSWKGYTIGTPVRAEKSRYPWRLDDERLVYPAYEKFVKSGIKNVCIHKGLFPPSAERRVPNLRRFVDVSDVGRAARDWPQLNFLIYHAGYRNAGHVDPADTVEAAAEFRRSGRIDWVTDLAEVPARWGVSNVYADLGQIFAETTVADPRLAAALLGTLIKGLGSERVIWGTDALWTGSPQWQIEGLRRLEIPQDMQKKYGYAPLGPANGAVKNGIFGQNVARLYGYDQHAELARPDRLAALKAAYESGGPARSNLRYGYVRKPVGGRPAAAG